MPPDPTPAAPTVHVCSRRSADPCPATEHVRRYTNGHYCPVHAPGSPVRAAHADGRPVRVLVTGSRTWDEPARVHRALAAFLHAWPVCLTVVCGTCTVGVERHAADWAREHRDHGVTQESERVASGADLCLAFICGASPGAARGAEAAQAAGIPTIRYTATTTHPTGGDRVSDHLRTALELAARGVPVLPLRAGKVPFGNCPACTDSACGGRPNMRTPGPCRCPRVCHAWAAATTDPAVINSPEWVLAWHRAVAVAYHPGGARLTVVDLDDDAAVSWARATLPPTKVVTTTRGEHWIYQGAMRSTNHVRPGVDIKSHMAYARWLGPGTGTMTALPDAVRALTVKEPRGSAPHPVTVPAPAVDGRCPHRTPAYLERGLAMAEQRIAGASSAVHATVYRTFLAVLSTHGRCGCLTGADVARLFTAAQAKGESPRHCADAWTNALTRLGL